MANIYNEYIQELDLKEPASIDKITKAEQQLGLALPKLYKDFLLLHNGGEGEIGKESYLVLWRVDDLCELNEAYGVEEFAPGLLLIGSDGGDTAFGFDKRSATMNVITVPFIGMSLNEVQFVGKDFYELLKNLHRGIDI